MTPPTVQFIPAATSGWTQLVAGYCTSSTVNHYGAFVNLVGDPIWYGRGGNSFYFDHRASGDRIQFYFANDTDRLTAVSSYSSWRVTGTDGLNDPATIAFSSVSRLFVATTSQFSAGNTYTIEAQ